MILGIVYAWVHGWYVMLSSSFSTLGALVMRPPESSPRFKALGKKVSRTAQIFLLAIRANAYRRNIFQVVDDFSGWWFGTFRLFFHIYIHIYIYIGNNHPNWLSYFSEGLKPSTSSFLGRIPVLFIAEVWKLDGWWSLICIPLEVGYGSIPINTIFRGMNIHLPAILMFTRGTRFWHTGSCLQLFWRWETHRNTMSVASKPASQHCHCFATLVPAAQWRCSWGGQHHDILRYTNVVADPALGQFCIGCCEKLLVGCQAAGAIMILDFGSSWWFSPPICPSNDDGADYVTPNWRICILVLICQFWQQSAVLFYGDCKMYPNFRAPLCTCTSFPDSVNTWILCGLLPFLSDPSLLLQVCFQNGLHCVLWREYNPNQLPMLPWPIGWPLIQSAHRCAWYLQHVYIFMDGNKLNPHKLPRFPSHSRPCGIVMVAWISCQRLFVLDFYFPG